MLHIAKRNTAAWTKIYVFCLLLAVVGCTGSTPTIELSPATRTELDAILNTLQARYDLTGSLKITRMMVRIKEGERSEELRELLWYKKSENGGELLQIQALGPYNEPRGIAIANQDKNEFLLALLNEQKAYVGPLSDGVLREIFGVDLRVSDVLSAIFANPFLDGRITNFISVESSGAKFIIKRPSLQTGYVETITLFIREGEPRVTEWHIHDENGTLEQRATFADYREVSGILRPHKVEIERPLEQTRVAVTIAKVELNVEIKDSKFDSEPFLGEDIEIIPLSELRE
ncbi:outer membrane lipoprotein-sorting protein [Candidatus Poribacteria bacterium]|nr:outer membrane lipoprotein-sorting protein [Candidatus Poribacteria bacterium]MYA56284.1 outer membrane lipoprotein-sorting protein [Candidatus Poribacteria bacterium]